MGVHCTNIEKSIMDILRFVNFMIAVPAYMKVHQVCAQSPFRSEEATGSPGTRVVDGG